MVIDSAKDVFKTHQCRNKIHYGIPGLRHFLPQSGHYMACFTIVSELSFLQNQKMIMTKTNNKAKKIKAPLVAASKIQKTIKKAKKMNERALWLASNPPYVIVGLVYTILAGCV
jgi:hypothetical protein